MATRRPFGATLDRLWECAVAQAFDAEEVAAEIERCEALVPGEDHRSSHQPYAEDASTAVIYSWEAALSTTCQEAAWSARRACDALDHYVQEQERMGTLTPEREREIVAHPLVQQELRRQKRDLLNLQRPRGSGQKALATSRATASGEAVFDLGR